MNSAEYLTEELVEMVKDFVSEYMYKNKIIASEEEPAEMNVRFFEIGDGDGKVFCLIYHRGETIGSILQLGDKTIVSYYYEAGSDEGKSLQH